MKHPNWLLLAIGLFTHLLHAQTVEYIHTDALGSPVAITSASGVVVERTLYDPYGAVVNRPLTNGPGYSGHVTDSITALSYMQQRYYDPALGRFLSVDPVTTDGGSAWNFNRYNYAANNPYKFKDPDGRLIDTLADIGFIIYDIYVLVTEGSSTENWAALGADSLATVVPFATGAGAAVRTVDKAKDLANAGEVADTVSDSSKFVPSPNGKMGGPEHQAKVKEVAEDIKSRELKPVQEFKVDTPGGDKQKRFVDVAAIDPVTGKPVEFHQVGKAKLDGDPVAREVRAIKDINGAKPDIPVDYHPYNR